MTLPIYTTYTYLPRTQARGLTQDCDAVQDLIEALKSGDARATNIVGATMARHESLRGFRGVVVPAPRSTTGHASLLGLAEALVRHGVGDRAVAAVERVVPVESSRERRHHGLPGIPEDDHVKSMGIHESVGADEPVLVVDDVYTTGSTVRAVARVLKNAGHTGPVIAATAAFVAEASAADTCPVHYRSVQAAARVASRFLRTASARMYHGTSPAAARAILHHGFDISRCGARQRALRPGEGNVEVCGVYLTTDQNLAERFYSTSSGDLAKPSGGGAVVEVTVFGRFMPEREWWRSRGDVEREMYGDLLPGHDTRSEVARSEAVKQAKSKGYVGFQENSDEFVVFDPADIKVESAYEMGGVLGDSQERIRTARGKATGDCYEAAAKYIIAHGIRCSLNPTGKADPALRLVHAEVQGQGPLAGTTFGHAWVLDGGTVIDDSNGRHLRMSKSAYYKLGHIDEINNHYEYTPEEARTWLLRMQVYGPWELHTKSGL